jgi:hypothetical protein
MDHFKTMNAEQEKALLLDFQVPSNNVRDAIIKAAVFRAYHFRVILPRVERMKEYVKTLTKPEHDVHNLPQRFGPREACPDPPAAAVPGA